MGQRHVARAQVVEGPEHAEVVLDGVAAFNPDQGRDPARGGGAFDIRGRSGQHHVAGMGRGDIVPDGIDHL